MSQAADEDDALAFTDLRKRFEQLANGGGLPGPSRPSTVPSQWIAPRSSSDRVYDRIAPKSPSASRIATQSLTPPPTLSPRGRGFLNLDPTQINIDTGKPGSKSGSRSPTPSPSQSLTPLPPSPSPTFPSPPLPPRRPSADNFTYSSQLSQGIYRKPPPPPPHSAMRHSASTDTLSADDMDTQPSFASLRSIFGHYSSTQSSPMSDPSASSSEEPFTQHDYPTPHHNSLPIFTVHPPNENGTSISLPPPVPPRPTSSTESLAPRGASQLLSTRSASPPPLPARAKTYMAGEEPHQIHHHVDHPSMGAESDSAPSFLIDHPPPAPPIPPRPGSKLGDGESPSSSTSFLTLLRPSSYSSGVEPPLHLRVAFPVSSAPPSASTSTPPLPYRHRNSLANERAPPTLPPRVPSISPPEVNIDTRPILAPSLPCRSTPLPLTSNSPILPPPVRTVGTRDLVPRSHAANGSEDSSSSDDEDADLSAGPAAVAGPPGMNGHRKRVDDLPDASRSSRRQPRFHVNVNVHAPAHIGVVAVAGNCVCVGHHTIKVYDLGSYRSLAGDDSPVHTFDVKEVSSFGLPDLKSKDNHRITTMGFRPAMSKADEGRFLWCGLKEGHLFEFDAWNGNVVSARANAHSGSVGQILRYGRSMVTIDDLGKCLIFSPPEKEGAPVGELNLSRTSSGMRSFRLPEKQGFARVFGDHLWTANGPGNSSAAGSATALRGPTIRVYDLRPGVASTTPKLIVPSDPVGQVLSGTVLQSQEHNVYIGHEGGCVTIWNRKGEANDASGFGVPTHIGTIKIGTSDVLSLEGVHARLWAGSRVGTITAYDVNTLPWTVTNMWRAHEEYPVLQIEADPYSIEKCARFTVFSVGRDERVRFWDGLLGVDHIESGLLRREATFSTFRHLKVLIGSWNIDAAKPEFLSSNADSVSFLPDHLRSFGVGSDAPDIIVFGFQEVIDLESRRQTAKNVLLGGGKRAGQMSDRVSRHYRLWHDQLILSIRSTMPIDCQYSLIHTEVMVGLLTCIFVKNSERDSVRDSSIVTLKRGLKGTYGNKGAIVSRFTIDDSSLCFINCHLAAGQKHVRERNADIQAILEEKSLFPTVDDPALSFVGGGDGSMALDHEICFLSGDLNYRIDLRRDVVVSSIQAGDLGYLLQYDQLTREMRNNPSFRLRAFVEPPITFIPTYKYDRRSSDFDSSEKKRVPAWCDRILHRCRDPERVECLHYRRYEANISDHRPISAGYRVRVKRVDIGLRDQEKALVENLWRQEEQDLLREVHRFYVREFKL